MHTMQGSLHKGCPTFKSRIKCKTNNQSHTHAPKSKYSVSISVSSLIPIDTSCFPTIDHDAEILISKFLSDFTQFINAHLSLLSATLNNK